MVDTKLDVFETVETFPNRLAGQRYDALVGLDEVKHRLLTEARLLLNPTLLEQWSMRHHRQVLPVVEAFRERAPLFVFGGDVGTGKTALAETFGQALAKAEHIPVTLMRLSLNARGSGRVGEMTSLLSQAFREVGEAIVRPRNSEKPASAVILLIDEADALAQSRELAQMHHEDRAGVNALIRGVDHLKADRLPVLVVMCTNRPSAIDPAIHRRAAAVFDFGRPSNEQRAEVLRKAFGGMDLAAHDLARLVELTGPTKGRSYGYTYSDLTMRLIPAAVIDAFPDTPLRVTRMAEIIAQNPPTAPFKEGGQ